MSPVHWIKTGYSVFVLDVLQDFFENTRTNSPYRLDHVEERGGRTEITPILHWYSVFDFLNIQ